MTKFEKWKSYQTHQWPIQLEYIEKCLMIKYLFEHDQEYCPKSWVEIKEDEFWSAVKKDVERIEK